jgi:hypothetical protein
MNDDRKLWDLLGASPRPAAPPFFAARVLRTVESASAPHPDWLAPLLRWLAPAAVAVLFLAALPGIHAPEAPALATAPEFTTLDLVEILSPQDYEVLTTAGYPYNNGFLSAGL